MSSDEGKLYVSGLSLNTEEQDLEDTFSKYGQLTDVVLVKDRENKKSRCYGFVTFKNPEDAEEAMEAMDGKFVDGKRIHVDHAEKSSGHKRQGASDD